MRLAFSGLVTGLLLGGLYATAALGLSLVYGVLRLVNLAHGDFMILGAYLTYSLVDGPGLDPLVSLLVVVPVMFVSGWLVYQIFLNSLLQRGSLEAGMVTTLGLSLVIQTLLLQRYTSEAKTLTPEYVSRGTTIFGTAIPHSYVLCLVVAAVLTSALHLLMTRTSFGRQARAASENAETASLMGIRVERINGITFALGAALSAVAGVLIGVAFSFTPVTGVSYLLKGFAVVVLGGLGSVLGTFTAGLLLGGFEGVGASIFGGGYRDLVAYVAFLAVLVALPRGLFASEGRQ